jgi:hypothetical protein
METSSTCLSSPKVLLQRGLRGICSRIPLTLEDCDELDAVASLGCTPQLGLSEMFKNLRRASTVHL